MKKKVEIIAEIGVNHNGNFDNAIKLIQIAKKCGADTVKFQTFFAEEFVRRNTRKVLYQRKNTSNTESHFEMIKKLELKEEDFYKINNFCKKININFLSTPYDLKSLKILEKINVQRYKTASTDLVDLVLHSAIIKTKKPVIISTGAANLSEIKDTINLYSRNQQNNLTLLHCVSNYPCLDKSLNLNFINYLKDNFNFPVGFSDHSNSNLAAILSVGLGCSVIEKHFTLNKNLKGPDHVASYDPKEFREYVNSIRKAQDIMGSNIKKVQREEYSIRKISRKSITLKKNLLKNHVITINDIIMKRPGTGINGIKIFDTIGKKIKRDLKKDYQLKKTDLIVK